MDAKGEVWLVNTVIQNNSSGTSGGGGYFVGAPLAGGGAGGGTDPCAAPNLKVFMQNCLITCNQSLSSSEGQGGGGVYFSTLSEAYLSNCTFSQNSAASRGGALYAGASCVKAYNSIFWDDTASLGGPEIANDLANLTIAYNVLEGGCAGVHLNFPYAFSCSNAINDNPDFLDPNGADNILCNADDDYRLKRDPPESSPAVDSGDNTKVALDFVDVDRNGNTSEVTPRDLAHRDRFVDDSVIPPHGTAIVDMGAYETAKCTTDAHCEDPASCFGNASCVSNWCDIAWTLDCNKNLKDDLCEVNNPPNPKPDCNNNTCPDEDEGECIVNALVSSVYLCNDSLPRIRGNVLRLTFKCDVSPLPAPPAKPVEIRTLQPAGAYGSDLAANFLITLEPGNKVLKIFDPTTPSQFANTTWYGIRPSPAWIPANGKPIGTFKRDYVAVYGDADNTKLTDFADLSFIFGQIGSGGDQNRSDIDGSGIVEFADISAAFGFNGSIDPGKPTGHACLP